VLLQGKEDQNAGSWTFSELTHCADEMSSTWLHKATKRSKNSCVPPLNISSCIVPLRLKVLRERMIKAK